MCENHKNPIPGCFHFVAPPSTGSFKTSATFPIDIVFQKRHDNFDENDNICCTTPCTPSTSCIQGSSRDFNSVQPITLSVGPEEQASIASIWKQDMDTRNSIRSILKEDEEDFQDLRKTEASSIWLGGKRWNEIGRTKINDYGLPLCYALIKKCGYTPQYGLGKFLQGRRSTIWTEYIKQHESGLGKKQHQAAIRKKRKAVQSGKTKKNEVVVALDTKKKLCQNCKSLKDAKMLRKDYSESKYPCLHESFAKSGVEFN